MARLYLFAEGPTEQTFADKLLKPHLAQFEVFLHPPVLIAHAKKKGIIHRGGGRNYPPMKNDLLRFMSQEKSGDVFFTTMIDLYAISAGFPKLKEAEVLRHLPDKRVEFLEQAFYLDIGDRRFVPYIQLHEYEAYLFSDPEKFRVFFNRHDRGITALKQIADAHASPEMIDDGMLTAPSKRIIHEFPSYERLKTTQGPQIAELIGLEKIRAQCPHFASWLTRLENLTKRVSDV